MALRNQPYLPLYVQDFLTDEKLIECSASATGVYIRLLCVMHKSKDYGIILLQQKDKQNTQQIKSFAMKLLKHLPYDLTTIEKGLIELIDEGVLSIDGDKLLQKRMIRDNGISIIRKEAGSKGGFAKAKGVAKVIANTENENENINEDVIVHKIKDKEKEKEKVNVKMKIGDDVYLTEAEHKKLWDTYGLEFTEKCIAKLDNYKGATGKKYKSDYKAILNWVIDEIKKGGNNGTNKGQTPRGTVDVDKHLREIEIARGETADVVSSRIHKRLG